MKSIAMSCIRLGLFAGAALVAGSLIAASDFENNLDKTFQVSSGDKFSLQAEQGTCKVTAVDGDKVQVHVLRQVKGGSQTQADELFGNHEVTFHQEGNTVSVVGRNKRALRWTWRSNQPYLQVRYEITVPKRFDVELQTSGGDVQVGDLDGEVKARTSGGSINLGRATGSAEAKDSGGDIVIGETGGDLVAQTSSGAIRVRKVSGKAEVSNSGGDIQIGESGKALVAKTSSGSIKVETAKADVEAKNSGGDIAIGTAGGDVVAETSSGSIHLGRIQGAEIKNSGGDITVEEADGQVLARTSSGRISIKAAKGNISAHNSGGDIHIEEAGGKTEAETSSGSIKLAMAKGSVQAMNSGGDVNIGEADGQVATRTSSGFIAIKLAKGKVDAKNSGGNIEVKEAQAAVHAATSSGTITVGLAGQPTEDCRLEVSGGGITVMLPVTIGINLDAKSSGGTVKTEIPIKVLGSQENGVLQGKINSGGPNVILRSSSGDIQVKAISRAITTLELERPTSQQ